MWARKLPYILASLLPVLLLVVLAINGRFFVSPWTTPEYGREASSQFAAYAPVIRFTVLHETEIAHLDEKILRTVTSKWLDLDRKGKLKSIDPICVDDDGSSGVRQEIELTRRVLLGSLLRFSDKKVAEGNPHAAAETLLEIMQIGAIGKYNSAMSITVGASAQREAIVRFERIRAEVSPQQAQRFADAITMLTADPARVQHFAARFGALSQSTGLHADNALPSGQDMKFLIVNDQALEAREFATPEHNLLVQTLHVAYKLELHLSEVKAQYRAISLKSQPESIRRLHANSG